MIASALLVRVGGTVQGVGFRPFVFRLARANALSGWVQNAGDGVEIHLEGGGEALEAFLRDLTATPPPAATIATVDVLSAEPAGLTGFTIRESRMATEPTTGISPDLALCDRCRRELFDSSDPRYHYPYINCTDCGPRFSIIYRLPYDRENTTMRDWAMDQRCKAEYHDPASRRFHAQPVACPACGPHYQLRQDDQTLRGDEAVIQETARLLRDGRIVAIKGLGGFHLACDATNSGAVLCLRDRKFRKEKPFALMVRDLEIARRLAVLSPAAEAHLTSAARPIVLAPARTDLLYVSPDNGDLGLMLPYTPVHWLLFEAGAPEILVMTSANRSSEPIAVEDSEALERLDRIADAFLLGERPIARRVEDSVVQAGALGPVIVRRGRGLAPSAVATLPATRPILALGADLKSSVTLVVDGQAFMSQHLGDLDHFQAYEAFGETISDLLDMYQVDQNELLLVHDSHPEYRSTAYGLEVEAGRRVAVQHHRAHVASVLAERGELELRVLGVSCDGAGYGDDGTIWGGEFFVGSVRDGFERVAHLRPAALIGGDAAARSPEQAAAGFLNQLGHLNDFSAEPFGFSARYRDAVRLLRSGTRSFHTTSMGRLFDTAAALLGFTRAVSFEGQAAIWLEHLARRSTTQLAAHPFPFLDGELDFRPLLAGVAEDRLRGRAAPDIARSFHVGVARGLAEAIASSCREHGLTVAVVSGGVFQNQLLLMELLAGLPASITLWTNRTVPPNDGGISLGQAALAAVC